MADLFDMKARLRQQAKETLEKKNTIQTKAEPGNNIFDAMTGPGVPEVEKSLDRLEDEGALLLGAGTETTARALAVSMFHVISNKKIGMKLRDALRTVMVSPLSKASWLELEQLPYLVSDDHPFDDS